MPVEWIKRAVELIGEGKAFAVITISAVEGSAPRETGAKMIVTQQGQWGTIGGGALEFAAAEHARTLLHEPEGVIQFEEFPLGPALGQCCGGRVLLRYERLGANDRKWLEQAQKTARDKAVSVERALSNGGWRIADAPAGGTAGAVSLLDGNGNTLAAIPDPAEIHSIRETVSDQKIPVYVFGAGHVGKAMMPYLALLAVSIVWIDRRKDAFPKQDDSVISRICTDRETEIAASAPPGACFFIMTHDHQLDYDIVHRVLERGDAAYCGLIGSSTKRARFEKRLKRAGLSETQLEHLRCPIGASGVDSKLPAVIALAAVHEMLLAHQEYKKGKT